MLQNVFNLAGPLQNAPQRLSGGVDVSLETVLLQLDFSKMGHIAHFNISGGPRDMNVPSADSSFERIVQVNDLADPALFFDISTIKTKNLYQSFDHNSQLYSRLFFNAMIPVIGQISASAHKSRENSSAQSRVKRAKQLLSFDASSTIRINEPREAF